MKNLTTAATTEMLKEIGMPAGLLGYEYVRYGIVLAVEDATILRRMTTALYPTVAKRFGTTPSRAERCIRHSIAVACDRTTPDVLEKYFGNTMSIDKGKPVNREFIATLADRVKIEEGVADT